jgi:hypothetical protein
MITDAHMQFSTAQTVTTTAVSTNTVDQGPQGLGIADELAVAFTVTEAVTAAGAATVTFQIITSDSASLTSPTVVAQTGAIGKAELTLGKQLSLRMPKVASLATPQRYLGVQYLVGTGPLTAGKFSAATTQVAPVAAGSQIYPAQTFGA